MSLGMKIQGRVIEILSVEDNPGDAALLKQVLKKAGFPNHLSTVPDGEQALDFLKRRKTYSQVPTPDVILLDLKLPKKDGLSVLNEIRQDPEHQHVPVIVLTGSDSELNVDWAKRLQANHYLVKPYDLEGFKELLDLLRQIWIKTFHKKY